MKTKLGSLNSQGAHKLKGRLAGVSPAGLRWGGGGSWWACPLGKCRGTAQDRSSGSSCLSLGGRRWAQFVWKQTLHAGPACVGVPHGHVLQLLVPWALTFCLLLPTSSGLPSISGLWVPGRLVTQHSPPWFISEISPERCREAGADAGLAEPRTHLPCCVVVTAIVIIGSKTGKVE